MEKELTACVTMWATRSSADRARPDDDELLDTAEPTDVVELERVFFWANIVGVRVCGVLGVDEELCLISVV